MEIQIASNAPTQDAAVKNSAEHTVRDTGAARAVKDAREAPPPPLALSNDSSNEKILSDILKSYNLKPTAENMKMLEFLIENRMPATDENLKFINRMFKLLGADPVKVLFFIENQIKLNFKNAETLQNFAEHKSVLTSQLENLLDSAQSIKDPALRNEIIASLFGEPDADETVNRTQTNQIIRNAQTQNSAGVTAVSKDAEGAETVKSIPVPAGDTVRVSAPSIPSGENVGAPALPNQPDRYGGAAMPSYPAEAPDNAATAQNGVVQQLREAFSANPAQSPVEFILHKLTEKNEIPEAQTEDLKKLADMLTESAKGNPPDKDAALNVINRLLPKGADDGLRLRILDSLTQGDDRDNLLAKNVPLKKFLLNPKDLSRDEFTEAIKKLNENLNVTAEKYAGRGGLDSNLDKVTAQIKEIRDSLSFLTHMKNDSFVQIPLMINDARTTAELYIFRGKNKKEKSSDDISALIAIDTVNIGRFETYIVKRGNYINLQFRLDNGECESVVRSNINALDDALGVYGYRINSVSYKKIKESFTLLDKEPSDAETDGRLLNLGGMVFDKKM